VRNEIVQMMEIENREAYIYHNTTHVWLYPNLTGVNFTDALAQGPVAVGGTLSDGFGGQWKVISISKSVVVLRGLNMLSNA